jgi:hypothetical protein
MESLIQAVSGNSLGQSVFLTIASLAGVFAVMIAFFLIIKLLMRVMPKGKE